MLHHPPFLRNFPLSAPPINETPAFFWVFLPMGPLSPSLFGGKLFLPPGAPKYCGTKNEGGAPPPDKKEDFSSPVGNIPEVNLFAPPVFLPGDPEEGAKFRFSLWALSQHILPMPFLKGLCVSLAKGREVIWFPKTSLQKMFHLSEHL